MSELDVQKIITTLRRIAKILHKEPEKALKQLRRFSKVIDDQIPYRDGHSQRVCDYALKCGKKIKLDKRQMVVLEAAALLHDFGKIGVEEDILTKPEDLAGSERTEVEKHVLRGFYILSGFAELEAALDGIRTHHEHYDGMGYPYGLANSAIPLIGRILSVVDAYDAITSDRPYRRAHSKKYAIRILREKAGTQFDPKVVKIFLGIIAGE